MPTKTRAIQIALWYAAISAVWIACSGWLLHHFVQDEAWAALLEDLKGWFFVVTTAVLLGLVVERHFREIRRSSRLLQDSEDRLHLVSDNLPEGYIYQYLYGPGGAPRFTYVSAGVERVHGVQVADVLRDPQCLLGQIDPAQMPAMVAAENESARQLTDFQFDIRIRRADGQRRVIRLRSHPRRNSQGHVQWEGFAVDATQRVQAGQALREQKELLEEMGRMAKLGGWEVDPLTGEGNWTDEVARIHDLDPADVFRLLVAELALDPQAQRRAVGDGQRLAVHGVGEDRLRVEGVHEAVEVCGLSRPGEKVVALWLTGRAADECAGLPARITIEGLFKSVSGYDCMNGVTQALQSSHTNGVTVIDGLLVKDYPILLRLSVCHG